MKRNGHFCILDASCFLNMLHSSFREEAQPLPILIFAFPDLFCGGNIPVHQDVPTACKWGLWFWWIVITPQATIFESWEQLDILCKEYASPYLRILSIIPISQMRQQGSQRV